MEQRKIAISETSHKNVTVNRYRYFDIKRLTKNGNNFRTSQTDHVTDDKEK